jgi:hypothetical protein
MEDAARMSGEVQGEESAQDVHEEDQVRSLNGTQHQSRTYQRVVTCVVLISPQHERKAAAEGKADRANQCLCHSTSCELYAWACPSHGADPRSNRQ